eukprot:1811953-Amphidinium_carterae.1
MYGSSDKPPVYLAYNGHHYRPIVAAPSPQSSASVSHNQPPDTTNHHQPAAHPPSTPPAAFTSTSTDQQTNPSLLVVPAVLNALGERIAASEAFMSEQTRHNCATADTLQRIFNATKELQELQRQLATADAQEINPHVTHDDYEIVQNDIALSASTPSTAPLPVQPHPERHEAQQPQLPPPQQPRGQQQTTQKQIKEEQVAATTANTTKTNPAVPPQPKPPLHACMERTLTAVAAFGRRRQAMQTQNVVPKKRGPGRPPKHEKKECNAGAIDNNDNNNSDTDQRINAQNPEHQPEPNHSTMPMPPQNEQPTNTMPPDTLAAAVEVLSDSTEY